MTAPTIVEVWSSQATATTSTPTDFGASPISAAVGDLCIIQFEGTTTAIGPVTGISYLSPNTAAGYTEDANSPVTSGTGSNRAQVFYKILVAGDITSGNLKALTATSGASATGALRIQALVVRPGAGDTWATDPRLSSVVDTDSVANDAMICTGLSGRTLPGIAVAVGANWGSTTGTIGWDGTTPSSGSAPYFDESSNTVGTGAAGSHYGTNDATRQSDFKLYDTGTTTLSVGASAGQTGTTRAVLLTYFQTQTAPITSGPAVLSGGGTFAATGIVTDVATGSLAATCTFAATGVVSVVATGALTALATFSAIQQGITTVTGTASFAPSCTFAATGIQTVLGTATLATSCTFVSTSVVQTEIANGGTWSTGSIALAGNQSLAGTGSFANTATFAATGTSLAVGSGAGQLLGRGTFTASGLVTVIATGTLDGGGGLGGLAAESAVNVSGARAGKVRPKWKAGTVL